MSRMNSVRRLVQSMSAGGAASGAVAGGVAGGVTAGMGDGSLGDIFQGALTGAGVGAVTGVGANIARQARAPGKIANMTKQFGANRANFMKRGGWGSQGRLNTQTSNFQSRLKGVNRGLAGGFVGGGAVGGVAAGGYALLPSNKGHSTYSESSLSQRLAYEKRKARIKAQEQMKVIQAMKQV